MSHMKIIPIVQAGDDAVRYAARYDATALKAEIGRLAERLDHVEAENAELRGLLRAADEMRAKREGSHQS